MSKYASPPLALLLLAACGEPGTGPGTTDTTGAVASSSTGDTTGEMPGSSTGAPEVTTTEVTTTEVTTTEVTTSATTAAAGCLDHPKLGSRAELATYQHGVSGTAEIRDDCTIAVSDFNYDGTGLDVRFYGGLDGDYAGGFALSDDLLKPGGYSDAEFVLTLPEGRTLDDLDGLSVWCVDVGVDFGSGAFAPP